MAQNKPMENETTPPNSGSTNDRQQSLIDRYTKPKALSLVKPELEPDEIDEAAEESGYRALVQYRGRKSMAPRFRIIDRKGRIYGCGYAYLLGWFYTPPDTLSIQTTTHLFTLMGKGLDLIEKSLLREMVMQIQEFRPGEDQEPEAGLPFIERIEVTSRWEEK